ncbi:MAG: signal peptidase I [Candidatus Heritagella sp.]
MEEQRIPQTDENPHRIPAFAGWTALFVLLGLIVAFFAGWLPAYPVVVATGSMEPAIGAGDVVIFCRTDPTELEVGDVIQYQSDGCTVIHRIVEKDGDTFITQGDANNAPDLHPVEKEQVLGRVTGTLPDAGWFILWLHGY